MFGLAIPNPFRRRPYTEVRYVIATRDESKRARQRMADVRLELEIMNVHLTEEQRTAAKLRAMRAGR